MPEKSPQEAFRQVQESILATLEQIYQKARAYPHGRQELAELEEKLLGHLQHQSGRLIPGLRKHYQDNREVQKRLEFLEYQIRELKILLSVFVDKYRENFSAVAARNFPIDLAELRKKIVSQLQAEEEYLIPLLARQGADADG